MLALTLAAFALPVARGFDALGHGGQPIALGAVPMTDRVLLTGDMDDFIRRTYGHNYGGMFY